MRPSTAQLLLTILLALLAPAHAAAQDEGPSGWRRAMQRLERDLDKFLDEITQSPERPAPLVGIFVPPAPGAPAAAELPDRWVTLTSAEHPPRRLVLLVHGLDEPGDIWCDLAPALIEAGHEVARFEYPNDQRVHASAAQLLAGLRRARNAGVEEMAVIAHSMGGLVTFDALTREDGYDGDVSGSDSLPRVTRLVAVGTPWTGSPWARMRAAAEIREQVQRWLMSESWDIRPILAYRRDGKGQAGDDLTPGSDLLEELAKHPLPTGLPFTVIGGRIAPAEPADLSWLTESRILREILGPEDVESLAADLREASETLGDGAVPLRSALARDSGDSLVFEVNHRALIRKSPIDFITGSDPDGPPGIRVILDRLDGDRADPPE